MIRAYRPLLVTGLLLSLVCASGAGVAGQTLQAQPLLKGKVLTAKGAPAAGCQIKFYSKPNPSDDTGGRRRSVGSDAHRPTEFQGKMTVAGVATTNEQGVFELKAIKPGSYRYVAGNPNIGLAGGSVTLEANKTQELTLTLNAPAGR